MKVLTLALLGLALAAGLLFLVLGPDPERGARRGAGDPDEAIAQRAPVSSPAPTSDAGDPPPDAPRRQSVETGAPAEVRLILEGAVIGEGAPVPGASLSLLRHEALLAETRTDTRGRFRIESAPLPAAGTLRVVARGFVPSERNLAAKPGGGTVMLGNLRLVRGQRLTGRVVDGRNEGIVDADVRAEPVQSAGDMLVARGRSGPGGRFELADAPPGPLLVTARAKGFGEQSAQYSPGGPPLSIQLEPGADLRIRLRTPRGQPVVGAEVTLQAPEDPRNAKRVAESDEEGRVLFEGLAARIWSVRCTHTEFRPGPPRQIRAGEAEETIECVPWPAIEGIVRAPGGALPPPGTRVQALPASAPSERVTQLEGGQEVRPDGSFRLGGLRAGDWRVRASAPGFAHTTSPAVKLGIEGDGFAGTIELQSGGTLTFSLTLEDQPLMGAEVEVFVTPPTPAQLWHLASSRAKGPGRRVTSGPEGLAQLENLSPGTVWVAVYAEGCPPMISGPHVVGSAPGAPIALALARGGRIQGRVLRKGVPVGRAQLRIVERAGLLGFPLTLASEGDGRYTSAWLPPGHYTIEAFAQEEPERRSERIELDLAAGENRTLDLQL